MVQIIMHFHLRDSIIINLYKSSLVFYILFYLFPAFYFVLYLSYPEIDSHIHRSSGKCIDLYKNVQHCWVYVHVLNMFYNK